MRPTKPRHEKSRTGRSRAHTTRAQDKSTEHKGSAHLLHVQDARVRHREPLAQQLEGALHQLVLCREQLRRHLHSSVLVVKPREIAAGETLLLRGRMESEQHEQTKSCPLCAHVGQDLVCSQRVRFIGDFRLVRATWCNTKHILRLVYVGCSGTPQLTWPRCVSGSFTLNTNVSSHECSPVTLSDAL